MASAPVKALTALFQDSELDIELDGAVERTGRAFFDQILVPTVVLRLPAAPKHLPPPASASEAPSFLLPIRTPFPGSSPDAFASEPSAAFPASEYAHDHHDGYGDDEQEGGPSGGRARPSVPRLLRTLLSLTRVQIDGAYAVSRAAATRTHPSSTIPVPSVRQVDKELSKAQASATDAGAASADQRPSALVPFHSQSWAGNKNERTAAAGRSKDAQAKELEERGQIVFESSADAQPQAGRWVVRWICEVPISFMQLPTMTPALSLTASLSLLLSSTQLSLLFDLPAPVDVFVGDQDLLSALSEGPVYPGESPSDRAQRTKSSLARLPLSQLSAQVIGTKLLTPETAAKEIKGRSKRTSVLPPLPDAATDDVTDAFDGDLSSAAGMSGRSPAAGGLQPSPAVGPLQGQTLDSHAGTSSAAFSRERRVLKRSCLRVLDVSSAVSVRLRTVLSPSRPTFSQSPVTAPTRNGDDDALEPYDEDAGENDDIGLQQYPTDEGGALLLCVELDHPLLPSNLRVPGPSSRPFGSLSFEITNVKIDVLEPATQYALDADANGSVVHAVKPAVNETLRATLFDPTHLSIASPKSSQRTTFPFVLSEGHQRNLVYCVDFIDPIPGSEVARPGSRPASMTAVATGHAVQARDVGQIRQVNIVVEARPLLAKAETQPYNLGDNGGPEEPPSEEEQNVERLPSFSSAWNCSVDIATARTNLRRRNEVQLAREHRERLAEVDRVPIFVATST